MSQNKLNEPTLAKLQTKLLAAQMCHPNAVQALVEEALNALDEFARAALSQPERHLTVTTTESGEAVMVSWQDAEHRILAVVWERKAQPTPLAEAKTGEPFGYIHHFVAHDDSGAIIDTAWEADGCADALPHPTSPAAWKWSHATPFYTTPQPAQQAQEPVEHPPRVTPEMWMELGKAQDLTERSRRTTPQPQPAPQVPAPVDDRAEFEASMRKKHGWEDRDFKSDSFGYFDGHTATAWLAWQARAALTLPAPQQATPKPVVPEMSSIALRKLGGLQDRGWQVNGYAIRRGNERGFVDASGFVGWWRSEIAPVAPDDHPLMVFAKECELGAYMEREVPLAARKAIAASQQKGGQ